MKLWLLKAKNEELPNWDNPNWDNPWSPWYDKAFGHVVRAETEEDAREIAYENAGDENRANSRAWKDPNYSTCVELTADGERGLVLTDFHSA